MKSISQKIVFFDGVCGLCNAAVDFILLHDRKGEIKFSPLQGKRAASTLPEQLRADLDTIVYRTDDISHTRSDAILRIARDMGGPWKLLYGFIIIPRGIRDWVYRQIAANRYKWFGKKETCRVPSPEERARFID